MKPNYLSIDGSPLSYKEQSLKFQVRILSSLFCFQVNNTFFRTLNLFVFFAKYYLEFRYSNCLHKSININFESIFSHNITKYLVNSIS